MDKINQLLKNGKENSSTLLQRTIGFLVICSWNFYTLARYALEFY